jgi:hypothetical protein
VFAADFLEYSSHEFIQVRSDLMFPDLRAKALGDTGKVRLYESGPERNQRVGNGRLAEILILWRS